MIVNLKERENKRERTEDYMPVKALRTLHGQKYLDTETSCACWRSHSETMGVKMELVPPEWNHCHSAIEASLSKKSNSVAHNVATFPALFFFSLMMTSIQPTTLVWMFLWRTHCRYLNIQRHFPFYMAEKKLWDNQMCKCMCNGNAHYTNWGTILL